MHQTLHHNYRYQLGLLLFLFGTSLVVFILMIQAVLLLFHLDLTALTASPSGARVMQSCYAFITLGLPALVFGKLVNKKNPLDYLHFSRRISGKQVFLIIFIVLAAIAVSDSLARINENLPLPAKMMASFKKLEDNYNKDIMLIAGMKSNAEFVMSLLLLAFLPAMMEEMLFRGCLQQVLTGLTRRAWLGILITSILFSAIHISFYGFLPRLFLGMVLGYLFYLGDNIWLNIWAHFFNNAIALTGVYGLSRNGKLTPEKINETMNESYPLYLGVLGLLATIVLLINFRKESEAVAQLYPDDKEPFNNVSE